MYSSMKQTSYHLQLTEAIKTKIIARNSVPLHYHRFVVDGRDCSWCLRVAQRVRDCNLFASEQYRKTCVHYALKLGIIYILTM